MNSFKYLNGVNSTVGYSGIMADSLTSNHTHRTSQIPECELNFSFLNRKGIGFCALEPDFFGGVSQ